MRPRWLLRILICHTMLPLLFGCLWPRPAAAYSLLTHEQLIDLTWQDSIVPLLQSRYPGLTPAQLEQARAYAYGGCVIQDIGYYPFGDDAFSNLTHYVRSGDFVVNLFRNAANANEMAFAVGALSHYIGDSVGHPVATNLAVPIEFPKLAEKYGPVVNYAEGEHQHVQTEFAFDIDQIAHHRLAPLGYLRHVGLKVPLHLLAVAYYQTYGLTEDFSKRRKIINVRTYRFAVQFFIPRIAYAVTLLRRNHEPPEPTTPEVVAMDSEVQAMSAANNWPLYRRKAGIGTRLIAGLIWILPTVGPLSLANVKGPTTATEAGYLHSVVISERALRRALARFTPPSATRGEGTRPVHEPPAPAGSTQEPHDPRHPLPNRDLDTGSVVKLGGYPLTDSTYADLLHRLTRRQNQPIPPGLKRDIEAHYANPDPAAVAKLPAAQWAQVQADLPVLATMPTSRELVPYPTYGDDLGDE